MIGEILCSDINLNNHDNLFLRTVIESSDDYFCMDYLAV